MILEGCKVILTKELADRNIGEEGSGSLLVCIGISYFSVQDM